MLYYNTYIYIKMLYLQSARCCSPPQRSLETIGECYTACESTIC